MKLSDTYQHLMNDCELSARLFFRDQSGHAGLQFVVMMPTDNNHVQINAFLADAKTDFGLLDVEKKLALALESNDWKIEL